MSATGAPRRSSLALALAMCTCRNGPPAVPAFTVSDSAGIRIVESTAPAWTDTDVWRPPGPRHP